MNQDLRGGRKTVYDHLLLARDVPTRCTQFQDCTAARVWFQERKLLINVLEMKAV